ncbi:MAG TPA: 50S ribosomal protein L20 [Candidatus Bathyarchaeia archaeon]|nr:50S ribosomal protein L20 [Candidatus Bathyarchaeia archaeon]
MRIKSGITKRKRHHKVLNRTKGFRMTKGRLYKVSKEADLHAGQYAFVGRKRRKRNIRRLWITRINAALKNYDLNYSQLIACLKKSNIELNRKILAELAMTDSKTFNSIINQVKNQSPLA